MSLPKFKPENVFAASFCAIVLHEFRQDNVLYYHAILRFNNTHDRDIWFDLDTTIFERCRACATNEAVNVASHLVLGVAAEVQVFDENMKMIEKFTLSEMPPHLEAYLSEEETGNRTLH